MELTDEIKQKYGHHKPKSEADADMIGKSRQIFAEAAQKLDALIPAGREKSVMHTHLETASFWGNAAIARAWGPAEPFTTYITPV